MNKLIELGAHKRTITNLKKKLSNDNTKQQAIKDILEMNIFKVNSYKDLKIKRKEFEKTLKIKPIKLEKNKVGRPTNEIDIKRKQEKIRLEREQEIKKEQEELKKQQYIKYISQIENINLRPGKEVELINNNELTLQERLEPLKELLKDNKKYMLKTVNGDIIKYTTLTSKNFNSFFDNDNNNQYSDPEFMGSIMDNAKLFITELKPYNNINKYKHNRGAYFNLEIKEGLNIDLSRYQIYKQKDENKDYSSCFLKCLINSNQLTEEQINDIILMIQNRDISLITIKEISKKHKLNISIKKQNSNNNQIYKYGNNNFINIGLINNHYFNIEDVKYTLYYIENIKSLNNDDFNVFRLDKQKCGIYKRRDEKHYINSYDIIKYMYEHKEYYFNDLSINEMLKNNHSDDYKNLDLLKCNLGYDEQNLKKLIYKQKDNEDDIINVFIDFETRNNNKIVKPYLCVYNIENDDYNNDLLYHYGLNCGIEMLDNLNILLKGKTINLIAHNMNFDSRFLIKHCKAKNILQESNKLKSFNGFYKSLKLNLKCSLLLIPNKLSEFKDIFKLEVKKEIINFDIYNNEDLFNERYINIDILKTYYKNDYNEMLKNAIEWNLLINDKIDIIQYSLNYCKIDVLLLKQGYNVFKEQIFTLSDNKININNQLTASSVGYQYALLNGGFNGCYSLSGIPSIFISKTIRGGKVLSRNNKKYIINEKLEDFDGVSLYPSAIVRLCDQYGGLLKGKPKIINNFNPNEWDGYFINIEILKYENAAAMPMLSIENKEGVKIYTNDVINKIFCVDRFTLEELIKYHNISYRFINGYGFNEGRNQELGNIIKKLFNDRIKLKKEKNPMQNTIKLIMNSIYGRTILKPIKDEVVIIDVEEYDNYISKYYNDIKLITEIKNYNNEIISYKIVKHKQLINHFNSPHIGAEILSISKMIMNEVIYSAEENGIKIYYTDTDSTHIKQSEIPKLSEVFKQKYNRELIGENLGQFHTDFSLKDCYNVVSIKCIILGKKSYIDILEGTDKEGKIQNGYHIRLKGIPSKAIDHYININNISYEELYKKLYNGEKITFNQPMSDKNVKFKHMSSYDIEYEENFIRSVQFI